MTKGVCVYVYVCIRTRECVCIRIRNTCVCDCAIVRSSRVCTYMYEGNIRPIGEGSYPFLSCLSITLKYKYWKIVPVTKIRWLIMNLPPVISTSVKNKWIKLFIFYKNVSYDTYSVKNVFKQIFIMIKRIYRRGNLNNVFVIFFLNFPFQITL